MPENSWPTIRLGYRLGADLTEVDVEMNGMLRPVDIDVFSVGNHLDGKKILKS